MSDKSGGYTLNRRGLATVEAAARRWGADAKAAFEAGQPIPKKSGYMPEFLESDEDFDTFAAECKSVFNPLDAEAKAASAKLDWTDPEAVGNFAVKWAGFDGVWAVPLWLNWLHVGERAINNGRGIEGGKDGLIRAAASEMQKYRPVSDPVDFCEKVYAAIWED